MKPLFIGTCLGESNQRPGFLKAAKWISQPSTVGQQKRGCVSKLNRRGKPQVLVHVSTYQGFILIPVCCATASGTCHQVVAPELETSQEAEVWRCGGGFGGVDGLVHVTA